LRQIVCKILSQKNPTEKRAGEWPQGVSPEFEPHKKKRKRKLSEPGVVVHTYNHKALGRLR
jgi:hypothetical protein